jgi:hypothetical protein
MRKGVIRKEVGQKRRLSKKKRLGRKKKNSKS